MLTVVPVPKSKTRRQALVDVWFAQAAIVKSFSEATAPLGRATYWFVPLRRTALPVLNLNGHAGSIDVAVHLLNSLLVALGTSAGTVVLATLAGYGFARLRFPGGGLLFMAMLAAFMIPFQAIITPLYVVLHTLGLSNSLVGLTLVYITFQLPFGLFVRSCRPGSSGRSTGASWRRGWCCRRRPASCCSCSCRSTTWEGCSAGR